MLRVVYLTNCCCYLIIEMQEDDSFDSDEGGDDQWISSSSSNQQQKSNSMPRSCAEARSADPTLKSGNYYVDPDGTSVGDDPIYVYCDMSTGN